MDCQEFNSRLQSIINEYNSTVLEPYIIGIDHFNQEQWGGSNFTDPIKDSFYDIVHLYNNEQDMYNMVFGGSKIFMVIGGGPSGLNLANSLADAFPEYTILVIDNRVVENHLRQPFTRYRIIYSLGNIAINKYEIERFIEAQRKPNIKFLFSNNVDLEKMIKKYNIPFVFNATGGRLNTLKNPYTNLIQVMDLEIRWDGERNCYELNNQCLEGDEDYVFIGEEHVITIIQDQNYMDIWTSNKPQFRVIDSIIYQEMIDLVENLEPGNVDLETIKDDLKNKFDINKNFRIESFQSRTRISKRHPLFLQKLNGKSFFKFDVGDALAKVPIALGTNIIMTERIIENKIIPTIMEIIQLLEQYQNCL